MWTSNQWLYLNITGRNLTRRSEVMHDNTTDTINSKWIINITYGVNNQHKEFTQNGVRCIDCFWMWESAYSLVCITARYGIKLKMEYLKATTHPPKISLEWPVTRLCGQEKELCKEEMITITFKIWIWYDIWGSGKELYTLNR